MYFKVEKGCDLFDRLWEIQTKMRDVTEKASEFVKSLDVDGVDHDEWYARPFVLSGGVAGIIVEGSAPEGWVPMNSHTKNGYRPHRTKKSQSTIRNSMKNLPVVDYKELNEVLDFESGIFGRRLFDAPSPVYWGKEFVLFGISDRYLDEGGTYEHPDNAQEITRTEFEQLKEQYEDEEKELK